MEPVSRSSVGGSVSAGASAVGRRLVARRRAGVGAAALSVASSSSSSPRAALLAELAHGQELEHPVLDVLEAVVVLLEDLLGPVELQVVFAPLAPGQLGDGLEVGADDLGLHRLPVHPAEAAELAVHLLADLLRQLLGVELLAQLLELLGAVLAELLLDRLELLAQEHLALAPAQLLLDLGLDVLLGFDHVELALDVDQHAAQALFDRQGLEQHLLLLGRDVAVAGDQVGQAAGVFDRGEELLDAFARQAGALAELGRLLPRLAVEGGEGRVVLAQGAELLGVADDGLEGVVLLGDAHRDAPVLALDEELHAVQAALDLEDAGDGADGVEVLHAGIFVGMALGDREDPGFLARLEGLLDGLQGPRAARLDGGGHPGEQDEVPECEDRKRFECHVVDLGGGRLGFVGHASAGLSL